MTNSPSPHVTIAIMKVLKLIALVAFILIVGYALVESEIGNFYHHNLLTKQDVTYFIDTQKYVIPWQYNPINGSDKPGGTHFVIHVKYPSLKGQYEEPQGYDLIISKQSYDPNKSTPLSNNDFVSNNFIYTVTPQGNIVIAFENQNQAKEFQASVVTLFNSFKVNN